MTPVPVQPRHWPGRRWGIVVAFVFVVQLGLIFGLSDKRPVQPRHLVSGPVLRLMNGAAELLALSDPTLFALPHRQGFSGLAWLNVGQRPFQSFEWSEDPSWLPLRVERLGTVFDRTAQADELNWPIKPTRPEPAVTIAGAAPLRAFQTKAGVRLEGALAGRSLIAPVDHLPQPFTDLLGDSVVQVVVDAEGRLVSVPVLLSSSGSPEADNDALRLARTARFNSVANVGARRAVNPAADLTWGRMVFKWETVPKVATNAVPITP